jgi:hypothetical protein
MCSFRTSAEHSWMHVANHSAQHGRSAVISRVSSQVEKLSEWRADAEAGSQEGARRDLSSPQLEAAWEHFAAVDRCYHLGLQPTRCFNRVQHRSAFQDVPENCAAADDANSHLCWNKYVTSGAALSRDGSFNCSMHAGADLQAFLGRLDDIKH